MNYFLANLFIRCYMAVILSWLGLNLLFIIIFLSLITYSNREYTYYVLDYRPRNKYVELYYKLIRPVSNIMFFPSTLLVYLFEDYIDYRVKPDLRRWYGVDKKRINRVHKKRLSRLRQKTK